VTIVAALVAACGGPPEAADVHVHWRMTAAPVVGEPALAEITLRDAEGRPVSGATVRIEGHMSHPGMAPVLASAEESGDGVYRVPFQLTMAGDWVLVVEAVLPDGRTARHQVDLANVQPSG